MFYGELSEISVRQIFYTRRALFPDSPLGFTLRYYFQIAVTKSSHADLFACGDFVNSIASTYLIRYNTTYAIF